MTNNKSTKKEIPSRSSGTVCWVSPSNIALVKYWGKSQGQIPLNPSISFVLRESVVTINISYDYDTQKGFCLESFKLNGSPNDGFFSRIENYLESLKDLLPFLNHLQLRIDSKSTFPHSAGIASSAAAFSALALCLCSIEAELLGASQEGDEFYLRASYIARLGSGSASRSLFNGMVLWGRTNLLPNSSDMQATRLDDSLVDPIFMTLRDAVLIVDDSKKAISSSQGHALMNTHPYRKQRVAQANENLGRLITALSSGDTNLFADVVENEALSLHSLMMSSTPGYILMKQNTLLMIEKIREFRKSQNVDVCFTLDAGPNIHLLYFEKDEDVVKSFITNELAPLCKNGRWIDDAMGDGPKRCNP